MRATATSQRVQRIRVTVGATSGRSTGLWREHVKEHTPVETKPLGYVYDDFAQIAFTQSPTRYVIGTNAYNADRTLPSSFLADIIFLTADQDCYVRFEADTRVEHLLLAGVQYEYKRRTDMIWVRRRTVDGTLTVRALGNEVGV